MIRFIPGKVLQVHQDFIKPLSTVKQHVPPNGLWIAYDLHLDDLHSIYYADIEVSLGEDVERTKGVLVQLNETDNNYYCLTALRVSHNSLQAAGTFEDTDIKVLPTTTLGYSDEVDRMNYISVPIEPYWAMDGTPIITTKRRGK